MRIKWREMRVIRGRILLKFKIEGACSHVVWNMKYEIYRAGTIYDEREKNQRQSNFTFHVAHVHIVAVRVKAKSYK